MKDTGWTIPAADGNLWSGGGGCQYVLLEVTVVQPVAVDVSSWGGGAVKAFVRKAGIWTKSSKRGLTSSL